SDTPLARVGLANDSDTRSARRRVANVLRCLHNNVPYLFLRPRSEPGKNVAALLAWRLKMTDQHCTGPGPMSWLR
ncbi:hypothetical protein, partial [Nocardia xishanensis]